MLAYSEKPTWPIYCDIDIKSALNRKNFTDFRQTLCKYINLSAQNYYITQQLFNNLGVKLNNSPFFNLSPEQRAQLKNLSIDSILKFNISSTFDNIKHTLEDKKDSEKAIKLAIQYLLSDHDTFQKAMFLITKDTSRRNKLNITSLFNILNNISARKKNKLLDMAEINLVSKEILHCSLGNQSSNPLLVLVHNFNTQRVISQVERSDSLQRGCRIAITKLIQDKKIFVEAMQLLIHDHSERAKKVLYQFCSNLENISNKRYKTIIDNLREISIDNIEKFNDEYKKEIKISRLKNIVSFLMNESAFLNEIKGIIPDLSDRTAKDLYKNLEYIRRSAGLSKDQIESICKQIGDLNQLSIEELNQKVNIVRISEYAVGENFSDYVFDDPASREEEKLSYISIKSNTWSSHSNTPEDIKKIWGKATRSEISSALPRSI